MEPLTWKKMLTRLGIITLYIERSPSMKIIIPQYIFISMNGGLRYLTLNPKFIFLSSFLKREIFWSEGLVVLLGICENDFN